MTPPQGQTGPGAGTAALLSVLITACMMVSTVDIELDLTDEGFLWYGAERTAAGGIPLRDFQSYEPGRYYWVAAGYALLGPGIVSLRISAAVFGALGLFCGLLCLRRAVSNPLLFGLLGCVLAVWMSPRQKVFDSSLAMMAVYFAMRLIEAPTLRRHFLTGIFLGVAAFFGRNHALYAGLGTGLVALWIAWKVGTEDLPRKLGALGVGTVLGASPLLFMLFAVSGFAESFLRSVMFFVERGSNHPLPVPWPWKVDVGALDWVRGPAELAVGLGFVLLVAVYGAGLLAAARTHAGQVGDRALLVASVFIGLAYAHHASVRSDASHLAQCIHPMLLALIAVPRAFSLPKEFKYGVATCAAVLTLFALPLVQPALARRLPGVAAPELVAFEVGDDRLWIADERARVLRRLEIAVGGRVGIDESIFIAPIAPGLYPLLGKVSPVWEIYFLWSGGAAEQARIAAALEAGGVDWALLELGVPFGREDLRFENSHPRVWEYLERSFSPVRSPDLPAGYLLLARKLASGASASE